VDQALRQRDLSAVCEEWHLTHTVTTGSSPSIPLSVAVVLVGFGDVSDYVGRRAAILWGVGASLVGTLLFALAPDVLWLFAGRAFMASASASPRARRPPRWWNSAATDGKARRHDHNCRPSRRFRGRPCCSAVPSFNMLRCPRGSVLGAVRSAGRPVYRGMVPAAPYRRKAHGRWRPKTPFIPNHLRNVFAVAAAAVNFRLHTWRTGPVARKSGCPRFCWIAQRARERRRSLALRDRFGRDRDWRQDAATSDRDDDGRGRICCRHGAAGSGSRLTIICHSSSPPRRSPAPDIACCFRRPGDDHKRGASRAPRRRALAIYLLAYVVAGCRLAPSRRGGNRARARYAVNLGAGVIALFSVITVALGRDDARSVVSDRYSAEK